MRVLLALLAAAALAGCQASPTLDRLRGGEGALDPFYEELRADVNATHDARYPLEVGDRASLVNVTLHLASRAPDLPADASPARLLLDVLLPSGQTLATGVVDAADPSFQFATSQIPERGTWIVHVRGQGVSSGPLEGAAYGASYVLALEVLHE